MEMEIAQLINDLKFPEARERIADGLKKDPRALRLRASLGRLEMMESNFAAAASIFAGLSRDAPAVASFHAYHGQCLSQLADAEAVAAFRRAIRLDPDNPYYLKLLERHFLKRGEIVEARRLYEDKLAATPGDLNALLALGLLADSERDAQALVLLQKAVQIAPDYARPLLLLGGCQARRGERRAAETAFARALAFPLAAQSQKEKSRRRISLYPCLELLYHAALLALGRFSELNPLLADFTRKHAEMLSDPRTYHDIVSADSRFIEFSYDEALAFFHCGQTGEEGPRPLAGEAARLQALWDASLPEAAEVGVFLRALQQGRPADATGPARSLALNPSRLPPILRFSLASFYYDQGSGDDFHRLIAPQTPDPTDPAARLARLALAALEIQALRRANDEVSLARRSRELADEWAPDGELAHQWPTMHHLLRAWIQVSLRNFGPANDEYLAYLDLDPNLDCSRLLYARSGCFPMQ